MEIGAHEIVHLPFQELAAPLLHPIAILTTETEEVALEQDALRLECLVIFFLHIEVTLGVSQDWGIALVFDALQQSTEIHRWGKDAGFHQQVFLCQGQEVACLEAALEKGIQHVLGCEMQLKGLGSTLKAILVILITECFEDPAEIFGLIRNIFHDVWGEPDFMDSACFIDAELLQALGGVLEAIIHAREDMAMVIDAIRETACAP